MFTEFFNMVKETFADHLAVAGGLGTGFIILLIVLGIQEKSGGGKD